jgi:4-hydroxy-tetrahydrodipicolinate synthase
LSKYRNGSLPSGVIAALITPFREDESLDEERLVSHIDFVIEAGVNGVMPIGGSGEYVNLTMEERRRVIDIAIKAAAGRVPVTVGALGPSTREALDIGSYAAKVGADALLVLPPYYIAPSEAGVVHHFASISSTTGLPVIVYNNPPRTARPIGVSLLSELANVPGVIGVKDCDRDLGTITAKIRNVHGRIAYLCGDDDLVYPSLAVGADGAIMALPNLAPRLAVALFKAHMAGDAAKALELHRVMTRLVHVRRIPNHPGPLREAMAMVQRSVGLSRRPLMPMTDTERAAVAAVTEELREYLD